MIGVSFVFSFIGVFLLGVPTYYYLLAKGWTAFWIAPLVGCVVANVTCSVFVFLFVLGLGGTSPWVAVGTLISPWTGAFGAVVGAIVWLIARPDRINR